MTNRAAAAFCRKLQPRVDEQRAARRFFDFVLADNIDMFVVRKRNLKIRMRGFAFRRLVENLARVRKRVARTALRLRVDVTNRTNRRFRALKELLSMTTQTGFVARVFRDVGKRIRLSDGFPVSGRKFMTRVALHFMTGVRKLGIARAALWNCRLSLRLGSRLFLLRARDKKFRRDIRVKNPARERAKERDNQRGADFSDFF